MLADGSQAKKRSHLLETLHFCQIFINKRLDKGFLIDSDESILNSWFSMSERMAEGEGEGKRVTGSGEEMREMEINRRGRGGERKRWNEREEQKMVRRKRD